MKFSVLMSVYGKDDSEFFRLALNSVTTEQILRPGQVVIVFDGVVHYRIKEVIFEIEKINPTIEFTVIENKENKGLAAALNYGLSACKYELVARMDADDISLPSRFNLQISYMGQHPEISVLGGAISEFITDGASHLQRRIVPAKHDDIVYMFRTRNAMNHMTVVYRKTDVISVGGYAVEFGKLEDYRLWVDLIAAGKRFANFQDVLVNARVGNGFIERRSNRKEIHDWDMLQNYMLQAGLISKFKSMVNKVYIRSFIYMPALLKKVTYRIILRK